MSDETKNLAGAADNLSRILAYCQREFEIARQDFFDTHHQLGLTDLYKEDLTIEGKRKRAESVLKAFVEGCNVAMAACLGVSMKLMDDGAQCEFSPEEWRRRYSDYLERRTEYFCPSEKGGTK